MDDAKDKEIQLKASAIKEHKILQILEWVQHLVLHSSWYCYNGLKGKRGYRELKD